MSASNADQKPPEGPLSIRLVVIFYGVVVIASFGLALIFDDVSLFVWHDENATTLPFEIGVGVGFGLLVVAFSRLLDRYTEWAERLGRRFGEILGQLSVGAVLVVACASGFAEELFFRGFLQQVLSEAAFSGEYARWWGLLVSSLIFGGLHVGPDAKTFLPWTVMAIVFGGAFGWMYLYTGNLVAPILSHFTINSLNIYFISQKYGVSRHSDG